MTTHASLAEIQRSKASVTEPVETYNLNSKTVRKWRKRQTVEYLRMGAKVARLADLTRKQSKG